MNVSSAPNAVAADGTISVGIPEDVELGAHPLAVYEESSDLIGWQAVTIVAPAGIGGIEAPGAARWASVARCPTREHRPRCG